jgi:hypothetical protein
MANAGECQPHHRSRGLWFRSSAGYTRSGWYVYVLRQKRLLLTNTIVAGKELPEYPSSKHKVTAQELLVDLSAFIEMEKKHLRIFFPNDASLQPASKYAEKVYNYLVGQGCPTETAMRFTALALYDLVILVGSFPRPFAIKPTESADELVLTKR